MSIFITIEGPDRVGKKTQTMMLAKSLAEQGLDVARVEVPINYGPTYKAIYWMLKNGWAKKYTNLFQFTQFVNKLIFQFTWLVWLRLTCDVIIFDRWSLSAVVYGGATGANRFFNRVMYRLLARSNMTLILHGSRHTDVMEDVYEADTDLQRNVKKAYFDWAIAHPQDHRLIDNKGTPDEVHERVMKALGF